MRQLALFGIVALLAGCENGDQTARTAEEYQTLKGQVRVAICQGQNPKQRSEAIAKIVEMPMFGRNRNTAVGDAVLEAQVELSKEGCS